MNTVSLRVDISKEDLRQSLEIGDVVELFSEDDILEELGYDPEMCFKTDTDLKDHLYPLRAMAKEAGLLPIDFESQKGGIISPASKENGFRIHLKTDSKIDVSEELYFELVEQIEKSNLISFRSLLVTATVEGDSLTIDPGLIAYIVKM